tara:strand:+ start:315 stop:587 length:273 start_codon:yes stop_codon:yes gene_type:complete
VSLIWKVYQRNLRTEKMDMVGACKYAEDAAILASNTSDSVIKANGRIVWRESYEVVSGDFFDTAADVMIKRKNQHLLDRVNKRRALEGRL